MLQSVKKALELNKYIMTPRRVMTITINMFKRIEQMTMMNIKV